MEGKKRTTGNFVNLSPYNQMLEFFSWLAGWHYGKYPVQEYTRFSMGEWLNTIQWTYWATFTTPYELTIQSARRMAENIGKFCIKNNGELIFWVAEKYDVKDGHHIHALIKTSTDIRTIWDWAFRRYGRSKIKRYNRRIGAGGYCAKYITQPMTDYDIIIGHNNK